MVGYTRALAVAVWLGTNDGKALTTKNGGSTMCTDRPLPRPSGSQFIVDATAAMGLDPHNRSFPAINVAATPSPTRVG